MNLLDESACVATVVESMARVKNNDGQVVGRRSEENSSAIEKY